MLNAAILGGEDKEFGRKIEVDGKPVQVNGWRYGLDKFMDSIATDLTEFDLAPRDVLLVWDGRNAKNMRRVIHPDYKAGRDKCDEVNVELDLAREACSKAMLDLGAQVLQQTGREADDVIGYLAHTLKDEPGIISTADGDLAVCINENTRLWRLGQIDRNPYGPFPTKYITLYKSLVGDSKDKIPGAKGFGPAAWEKLVLTFGLDGLDMMTDLILTNKLHTLSEDVGDMKELQKVIDSAKDVVMSWNLAKLYVDDVNTMRSPLQIQAGMVKSWEDASYQCLALRRFYATKTLVTAENYQAVYERLQRQGFADSPFIPLDIETSAGDQSDEWMASVRVALDSDRERFDVLGHELTGMSLTFGQNTQHTIYMSVDHKDTANITVDQCREVCELIPQTKHIVVQNRAFEFSVLYRTWGEKWKDNGWHGFLPNCIDTQIGASYVDENIGLGLKKRSLHHLGYEQATFEQTTRKQGPVGSLSGGQVLKTWDEEMVPAVYEQIEKEIVDDDTGEVTTTTVNGKLQVPAVTMPYELREYKMKELTGLEVFDYGCDDTITAGALHTHYKFVMALEHTWDVYLEVEQLPEYLTSLAYVQGIPVSMPTLIAMEKRDEESYSKAWGTLRDFLMSRGWDGTTCPEFEGSIEPSDAKMAVDILLDGEFSTKKRKLKAIALDIREQFPDNSTAELLAAIVEQDDVAALNSLIKSNFTGEPKINFGSPKQMQNLFYRVIGIPVRIVNKMTDIQRKDPVMSSAFKKRSAAKRAKIDMYAPGPHEITTSGDMDPTAVFKMNLDLTDEEYDALISKASTDDTAVDTAIALDNLPDDIKKVLKAYKTVKEVQTRQNLFYKTYKAIPHWRDGRIHPSLNQARAVTRRYSASQPNIQQLPSRGEGARFREVLLPHHKDAVVVSLDWSGQELRLGAELSGDEAMTSCFVGEKKRDMHSLTAVAAAVYMWGQEVSYEEFQRMRTSEDPLVFKKAKKLREDAKTVNFASQYGAMAAKIAETMMCEEDTAQAFLDARAEAFPGIIEWDQRVQAEARECGYARTMMGARRHLREALSSDNQWERQKAERQVGNFWIQGSAAEMNKLAMARVWNSGIVTGKYDAVFYCPIHDELVFSVHKDQVFDFLVEAHAIMVAKYSTMKIPLESSISIGRNFACDFEVGSVPNLEAVNEALKKIFQKQEEKEAA